MIDDLIFLFFSFSFIFLNIQPERMESEGNEYSIRSDVWSLGYYYIRILFFLYHWLIFFFFPFE